MRKGILLVVVLACAVMPAAATTSARAVLDQARHLSQTTRKWNDRVQHMQLRIIDRLGGERNRKLVMDLKRYPQDRNRSIVFFEEPPEVKGIGFLQWADSHGTDEQWLYLPELKRIRKISAGAKHDSFMGTDFSYDDLAIVSEITDWTDADAATTLLRDESVDGRPCHVIEFKPTGKDVSYSRIVTWLTADDFVIIKFEMYDDTGALEKLLTQRDIRQVGAIPTPFHMEMANKHDGSRTIVRFDKIEYDTGLPDNMFTQRSLERGL